MDVFQLRKEAQEKLGLDDAQADAFVEGFIKEAGYDALGNYKPDPVESNSWINAGSIAEGASKKFGESIGGGIGNLAINGLIAGVAGVVSSAKNAVLYRKFTEALKTVVESNRIVRNADRNKVISYADTIYKFAPHVAADANLLSQLLANAIHGEGVDPSTIETITRLEERYSKDTGFKPKNFN